MKGKANEASGGEILVTYKCTLTKAGTETQEMKVLLTWPSAFVKWLLEHIKLPTVAETLKQGNINPP